MKVSDLIETVNGEYRLDLSERNAEGGKEQICYVCNTWNGVKPYMDRHIESMWVQYDVRAEVALFQIMLLPEKVGQAIEGLAELTKEEPKEKPKKGRQPLIIPYKGEQHTLREWSEITGINYNTLKKRYYHHGKRGEELFYEWGD